MFRSPARRTKIVATLGPATDRPGVLDAMVVAGLDVARINCSHGTRADHARRIEAVRQAAEAHHRPVAVLIDIQGPKLRVASLPDGTDLTTGDTVSLAPAGTRPNPGCAAIPVGFDIAHVGVEPGQRILLDDGRITLTASAVHDDAVVAEVRRGGTLTSNKGVNFPDTGTLQVPALSDKDRADLTMAGELAADWVGVSFVSTADDVHAVRSLLPEGTGIIAKIERPVAVDNFDSILAAADAVMVARGDLGVETPFDKLPMLQKDLISRANIAGVPVVTATEMLESMTTSTRATRAEVTDVANAVLDGTDAVMLSGETAAGVDPVAAITTMAAVVASAEASDHFQRGTAGHRFLDHEHQETAALTASAAQLSRDLNLDLVAVFTETGRTARIAAEARLQATVVAFAHERATWRRLALYWGIRPVLLPRATSEAEQVAAAEAKLVAAGFAGARAAFVIGPPNRTGSADTLTLRTLPQA